MPTLPVAEHHELAPSGTEFTITDAAGNVSTGKYMALYEKRSGHYVCIREMYNNDQPSC